MSIASIRERYARLTPREWAVIRLLALGRTQKDATHELGYANDDTVRQHAIRAMRKLGADSARRGMVPATVLRDFVELQYGDTELDLELLRRDA